MIENDSTCRKLFTTLHAASPPPRPVPRPPSHDALTSTPATVSCLGSTPYSIYRKHDNETRRYVKAHRQNGARENRYGNRLRALPRRHGNVVTPAWQRCYGGVATLLRRRGNVVTGPWQRCYGPVATLLWARGNVDMGPWQRTRPHTVSARCLMVSAKPYVQSSYALPSSTPS